jgi:Flp pilus assembly protein TadB
VSVVAAFLTAAVAVGCFAWHLYQSGHAMAAPLRPTVAVLSQPGVATSSRTTADAARVAAARRNRKVRPPDHGNRLRRLQRASPSLGAGPVGHSGQPLASSFRPGDLIFTALFVGFTVVAGAAVMLILGYLLCRMILDRHRLARWESAWAAVGAHWTGRR